MAKAVESLKHGMGLSADVWLVRLQTGCLSEMAARRVVGMLRRVPRAAGPARELHGSSYSAA